MPEYIPSNTIVDIPALLDRRPLPVQPSEIFSVARYALLYYLQFLSERRGREIKYVLLPDYMCHEVAHTLRDAGYRLHFYPLDNSFDVSLPDIKMMIEQAGKAGAFVVTHFYGRLSRNLTAIAQLCSASGIPLIEDCVHLPFPYYSYNGTGPGNHASSDAKIYTFRKVYPVPYGATIALRTEAEDFAKFLNGQVSKRFPERRSEIIIWGAKQMIKKSLQLARLGYTQSYRDLSQDPLKPFNFLRPGFVRLLSMRNCEDAVSLRRRNYQTYLKHAESLRRCGTFLEFDIEKDVPYMFVLRLKEGLRADDAVQQAMQKGIPAALGLALDPEVLNSLPPEHFYRRIVVLPIHQDIAPRHIDYIAATMQSLGPAQTNDNGTSR